MEVLEDVFSEMGEEAARGREILAESQPGMEKYQSQEQRETGVVRSDVAQKTASGSQSSKAEVGPCDVSRVTSTGWARWEGHKFLSSAEIPQKKRTAVIQKEFAETQEYVSYQDTEVDDNKSLEELQVQWASLFGSCTCATRLATKRAPSPNELASIVTKRLVRRSRSSFTGTVMTAG